MVVTRYSFDCGACTKTILLNQLSLQDQINCTSMESLELIHADYRKISNLEGKSANDFDSLHSNLDWDQVSQLLSVAKDAVESSDGRDEKNAAVLLSTQRYLVRTVNTKDMST